MEQTGFYFQLNSGKTLAVDATAQGTATLASAGEAVAELTAQELQDFARLCIHFADMVREIAHRQQHQPAD